MLINIIQLHNLSSATVDCDDEYHEIKFDCSYVLLVNNSENRICNTKSHSIWNMLRLNREAAIVI